MAGFPLTLDHVSAALLLTLWLGLADLVLTDVGSRCCDVGAGLL